MASENDLYKRLTDEEKYKIIELYHEHKVMWCSDSVSVKTKAEKHAAKIKLTELFENSHIRALQYLS